ncbi:8-oxo-dGTP pyrophosphatase MutT (NUDIX family) [Catenuloplanes nepalensis]|uniref:8-oxo-dGTP pyrophosphatase MutT (NUDIX family) n=1 Tax=Catenuloplanes nepalensis TaxID=587533 RepID=A0ABT9N3N9_9ACTN|nr:NUDIX domain-containing protein [Catenuloplanes nepalensis]MDP9798309.1 8-oxo-dGTP pyrophosphatase MutT (NUDIX family) [Catenuloplanes nepalensis]
MTFDLIEYTDPAVLTEGVAAGWAEPITDPTAIDWTARQRAALLPFEVTNGRPVSPGGPNRISYGRNGFGRWGENPMADALVTATFHDHLWVLLVERGDGAGWAMPGGSIDPGETPADAAVRELAEETGLYLPDATWTIDRPRWVPDPRGSAEAWAVTVVARTDLGGPERVPQVRGADDARRACWLPADPDIRNRVLAVFAESFGWTGHTFPAHRDVLNEVA